MSDHVKYGVHAQLEAEADAWIKKSTENVTRRSEKSDILTPWKEQDRRSREVYPAAGFPDANTRRGMFHRSHNPTRPDLNSRDGIMRPNRFRMESIRTFADMNRADETGDTSGFGDH
jgi:hypothetical protein